MTRQNLIYAGIAAAALLGIWYFFLRPKASGNPLDASAVEEPGRPFRDKTASELAGDLAAIHSPGGDPADASAVDGDGVPLHLAG